jgi:predicted lipoprotein with Yx(FWY)xxD motif
VSGLEKVMEGIASQAITSCFQASSKSMGRFSDCIVAAQEKLTKQGERTMAKMQFINMTISQCIRDGKGESACNDEAKELGKKLV